MEALATLLYMFTFASYIYVVNTLPTSGYVIYLCLVQELPKSLSTFTSFDGRMEAILSLTFKRLSQAAQGMFLDVASGIVEEEPLHLLLACWKTIYGCDTEYAFDTLLEYSLVKKVDTKVLRSSLHIREQSFESTLAIHDVVRELGRKCMMGSSLDKAQWTRLWKPESDIILADSKSWVRQIVMLLYYLLSQNCIVALPIIHLACEFPRCDGGNN